MHPTEISSAVQAQPVKIEVVATDAVNFAMVHNSVPVVRDLAVTNNTGNALENLIVAAELSAYSSPWYGNIARLAPGATHHFEELDFKYDEKKLINAAERDRVALKLGVYQQQEAADPKLLASRSEEVSVLAYNEWRRDTEPQMLASFVLPNHPAVQKLLDRARQTLAKNTGNPSMGGYQSNDVGRVRSIAQAIYEAIGALGVTYANPPASFEETGQKIRTPEQIITDKVATCLDVSVLLAAAMEQVGLHPLVVLIKEHAFPGVWLREDYRGDGGMWDGASVRNELSLGMIEVFDSSAAVHQPPVPFDQAAATAAGMLQSDDEFRFALDVRGARTQKYRPLPSRVYGAEFGLVREVQVPTPAPAPVVRQELELQLDERDSDLGDPPEVLEAKARLRLWQKKLLDLTLRNRLLNFYPNGKHGIYVQSPEIADLEDRLSTGTNFVFHPAPGVFSEGDARSAKLRRAQTGEEADIDYLRERQGQGVLHSDLRDDAHLKELRKLERKGKESFEEAGAHTVFLALGLLRWFEAPSSQQERFAPLILVPVQLKRGSARDPWRFEASDEPPVFNPSLIEKLKAEFDIDLSVFTDELPADDAGIDVPGIFHTVRTAIRGSDRWELKEEAHLAHFSFTKQVMWRDLDKLLGAVKDNDMLRALARKGRESFPSGSGVPRESELDEKFQPTEVFCPLDSDSSQLSAILAAANGESFVLQGPPGTGKSQTITNLITHCLAVGKTVLFVSAKMAALQVVHRRLKKTQMDPFCLELHSHSAKKKVVLEQLSQALHAQPDAPAEWQEKSQELAVQRARLNGYAEALHKERPQGASLRDGMGKLCKLKRAPKVRMEFGEAQALTVSDLRRRETSLAEFATVAGKIGAPPEHALVASSHTKWSPVVQDAFVEALSDAQTCVNSLTETRRQFEGLLGVSLAGTSLKDLRALEVALAALSRAGQVSHPLLQSTQLNADNDSVLAFIEMGRERDALKLRIDSAYTSDFYQLNLADLALKLRTWSSAFFLFAFFMLWTTRSLLKSVRKDQALPANALLLGDVEGAREVGRLDEKFAAELPVARTHLEALRTEGNDWETLGTLVVRTVELRLALDKLGEVEKLAGEVRNQFFAWAGTQARESRPVIDAGETLLTRLDSTDRTLNTLATTISLDPKRAWDREDTTLESLSETLAAMKKSASSLRDWTRYQATCGKLWNLPEGAIVRAFEAGSVSVGGMVDALAREYTQKWVSHEYQAEPVLAQFDGDVQTKLVESFRHDDANSGKIIAKKAHAELAEKIPRGGDGEMAVLHRELTKQRRHMPIRKLFREIPTVRRRLKPCLLMSPLSVAQYLSADERFDLVIFDEASQLPTPDAVGAIARGRQLVVVGDSKQLPPTAFFAASDDADADNPEAADEVESILDECIASQMQELPLRWHYRSQHEHLIAFSNAHYYDDKLFTFASAEEKTERLGVKLVPVPNGYYEKGKSRTNRIEAETLVAEVVRRLKDPVENQRSIGIVTFSVAQQQLVEDLLELQRTKHPSIEPFFTESVMEPVFVKNLENVQGDERDVILFSICYGPDQQGKVSMNFGPLNKDGGERRLNVAITRARQLMMVFSTLRYDQVDLKRSRAVGVKHLRRFLQYAKDGPSALAQAIDVSDELRFDSPFEEEIYEALTARGHDVITQVGCSGYRVDMAIIDPDNRGRFLLGIECDGAAYHSAKTARDRDRLRQSVLESLGWKLHRIWSTDWWTQPEGVLKRLDKVIAEAKIAGPLAFAPGANSEAPEVEGSPEDEGTVDLEAQVANKGITPPPPPVLTDADFYEPAILAEGAPRFEFDAPQALPELEADLRRIIAAEAPVHLRVVGTRLSVKWGITRITQRVLRGLNSAISANGIGLVYEEVLWESTAQRNSFDKVRRPSSDADSSRKIEDIPREELLAAGRLVLGHSLSVSRDEFIKAIARVFGIKRAGSKVVQILEDVVQRLIADGHAKVSGENITLPR